MLDNIYKSTLAKLWGKTVTSKLVQDTEMKTHSQGKRKRHLSHTETHTCTQRKDKDGYKGR